jgi:small Trp-rich protein
MTMYFLLLGLILLGSKVSQLGPAAHWSWWVVLAPFALTVLWWTIADWAGYTRQMAIVRELARRKSRIRKGSQSLTKLGGRGDLR